MRSRSSSGSRRSESAVEPTKSQNITVSWRRSAAAGDEVEGDGSSGAFTAAPDGATDWSTSFAPQAPQNLAAALTAAPHFAHTRWSCVPHCSQKLSPASALVPQPGHCIDDPGLLDVGQSCGDDTRPYCSTAGHTGALLVGAAGRWSGPRVVTLTRGETRAPHRK